MAAIPGRLRLYSVSRDHKDSEIPSAPELAPQAAGGAPWYVAAAEAARPAEEPVELPPMPANAPSELPALATYLVQELGLIDLEILDARDVETALGPAIVVVASGKSIKHLGKAAAQLSSWIKKEYGQYASREGVLSSNFVRVHRRRAQRKAERLRFVKSTPLRADTSDQQKTGSWIAVDTHIANIHVHLFIPERREDLDLTELLTAGDGEAVEVDLDEYAEPAQQTPAVSGRREFHTSARRFHTSAPFSKASGAGAGAGAGTGPAADVSAANHMAALQKLDASELTPEGSAFVKFVQNPPALMSSANWSQRLALLSDACESSAVFPLALLPHHFALQLASGSIPSRRDAMAGLETIAYAGEKDFSQREWSVEAEHEWHELCNKKAEALRDIHELAYRALGKSLLRNKEAAFLLFRTFVAPTATSITPTSALSDLGTPTEPTLFEDHRAHALSGPLLESNESLLDPRVLTVTLTILLNAQHWDELWSTLNRVANVVHLEPAVLAAVAAMVVKTGDERAISFLLHRFLPGIVSQQELESTPELARALNAGLAVIGAEDKVPVALRGLLEQQA